MAPTPVCSDGRYRKTVESIRKRMQPAAGGYGCGYGLTIQVAAQIAGFDSLDRLTDDLLVERGGLNPDLLRWLMGYPKAWSNREWIGTTYLAP